MTRINSFEEIDIWQKARQLVVEVYKITKIESFSKDFGLKDQVQRAAVSVMSNIAEGFERKSEKEFIRFLYISKGSAGELRSLLCVALDLKYLNQDLFEKMFNSVIILSKQIYRFIEYLENCQNEVRPKLK